MKKGFTLLEVLLSVAIMASGVLTVVVLYSLGFRETRQSNEDVASAAFADSVMAPIVNALSQTNLAWSTFNGIGGDENGNIPEGGWAAYYDRTSWKIKSDSQCKSLAGSAISAVKGVGASNISWPNLDNNDINGGLQAYGLVVRHRKDSSVVKVAFRAARNAKLLMAAPMYYTEVRFQGDPSK